MEKKIRWKRRVDRRMRYYGEIDYEQKLIRVNPSRGDLINTIIHEEMHKRFPEKSEQWIRKKTKERERKMTINEMISFLERYRKKKNRARPGPEKINAKG